MPDMSMRERMLAVVQGRMPDRVPFVQYSYLAAFNDEIWALLGRENMGVLTWTELHQLETPHCRLDLEDNISINGKHGHRATLHTPEGDLHEERLYEPTYFTTSAATHFVKQPEDYRILMAYFRDIEVHPEHESFSACVDALREDGLPHAAVLRSPFQQLWVQWVDLQDLAIHLALYPDIMEEVFAAMRKVQRRVFEVACDAVRELPVPYVVVPDNITAPVIGETYFRAYCMPAYQELADMLADTGKDVPVYVHMDGDLKALWNAIGDSAVRGLDSMSPPPDNDTPVDEALARWPEMRLGINFPSSLHLTPPENVYAKTMELLEQGGRSGRLQIQISENVPPGMWRQSFPAIARAIHDFGKTA